MDDATPRDRLVEVRGLVKVYRPATRALDGIDLDIGSGRIFALLGPNGAGKTTLMRILTTQLRPTAGRASVFGRDVVRQADAIMTENGAARDMAIWCMIETPRGILHCEEIAGSSPRIRCLVMGTSDLAKNLGAAHTRERLPFLMSLEMCLLAARACDVAIVDGVHLDLEDDEGFAHACRQGAELGFDGKTLIHPKTIATANTAFSPSAAELAWSRRIIDAWKAAHERGEGLVVVDGKLIENLHVEGARRTLLLDKAIADIEAEAIAASVT